MTRGDTAARIEAAHEAAREDRLDRFFLRFLLACAAGLVLLAMMLVARVVVLAWGGPF